MRIEETCESCKKSGLACDARNRTRESGKRSKAATTAPDSTHPPSSSSSSTHNRPTSNAQGRRDYPPSSPLSSENFGLEVSRRRASPVKLMKCPYSQPATFACSCSRVHCTLIFAAGMPSTSSSYQPEPESDVDRLLD